MHDYSQDKIFLSDFGIYEDIPWPDTAKSFITGIEENQDCGVYKITNSIDNRIYVGSSKELKVRWERHKWQLMNNCHHSSHFQHFFNKHKNITLKIEIIEECHESDRKDREQFYLDTLNPFGENGFNISKYSCVTSGLNLNFVRKNPDVGAKLALIFGTPINQYSLNGNFIKQFAAPYFAAKETGLLACNVGNAAYRSSTGISGGYIWRNNGKDFSENDLNESQLDSLKERKKFNRTTAQKLSSSFSRSRRVGRYNLNNILLDEYDSMAEAALKNDLKKDNIRACCRGYNKSGIHAGFKWKWISDSHPTTFKKVGRFSANNKLLEIFNSSKEAKETGLYSIAGISKACSGATEFYKGFIWKYLDA